MSIVKTKNYLFLVAFLIGLTGFSSFAQPIKVDTEMAILIDSSASISDDAYITQKETYRNALVSNDVVEMIMSNYNQSAAISIIEFSGGDVTQPSTYTIAKDFIVSNEETMRTLINLFPEGRKLFANTNTIEAINLALDTMYTNGIESSQRIINVIIDGAPTDSSSVYELRARLHQLNDPSLSINCMIIGSGQELVTLKQVCNQYITYGPKGRNYQLIDDQMQYMLIDNFSLEIY